MFKNKLLVAGFTTILALAGVFAFGDRALAATPYENCIWSSSNPSETHACNSICPAFNGNCGAMWVSVPGSPYKQEGNIVVDHNQTNIALVLRGSANKGYTRRGYEAIYAASVDIWQGGRQILHNGLLYRGTTTGINGQWGSGGNELWFNVDVSGVPAGQTRQIILGTRRCFGDANNVVIGTCSSQSITITVTKRANPWYIEGQSYIKLNNTDNSARRQGENAVTARPGDTLYWDHDLRARGSNMDRDVRINIDRKDVLLATGQQISGFSDPAGMWGRGWQDQLFFTQYNINWLVTQDDVGEKLCQRIAWEPQSQSVGGWGWSNFACANIPYTYSLNPVVNLNTNAINEDNATSISGIGGTIENQGPTKSHTAAHAIARFVVRGRSVSTIDGARETTLANNNSWVCGVVNQIKAQHPGFNIDSGSCKEIMSSGGAVFNKGSQSIASNKTDDIRSLNLSNNDSLCYVAMVNSYTESRGDRDYKYSIKCIKIAKSPKVQVWGGDVKTGKEVKTLLTREFERRELQYMLGYDKALMNSQRHWYFGQFGHVDFGQDGNHITNSTRPKRHMQGAEGSTVVTDKNGVSLFYTDGLNVHHADGVIMKNGTGLASNGTTTQAAASFPIANDKYVIVYSGAAVEHGREGRLKYSIVDLSKDGVDSEHRGEVLNKNYDFGPDIKVSEGISVVPDLQNKSGYWVVANEIRSNNMISVFVPYNWSDIGNGGSLGVIRSPATSGVMRAKAASYRLMFGTINFNRQYNVAVMTAHAERGGGNWANSDDDLRLIRVMKFEGGRFTDLYDWEATGPDNALYSADFSPNEKYIYVSSLYNFVNGVSSGKISRYKNSSGSSREDVLTLYGDYKGKNMVCHTESSGGQVKRAPIGNNRMYFANLSCDSIGVIENPDASNISMVRADPFGHKLSNDGSVKSSFGLPQFAAIEINGYDAEMVDSYRTYGSWAEYAITAKESVTSASGAGLSSSFSGRGNITSAIDYNKLTFANTPNFGQFSSTLIINNNYTAPKTGVNRGSLSGTVNASNLQHGNYTATNLNINGGTIAAGRGVVIESTGTVTISGNINYATTNDASKLPQLIIKAKNIVINPNVTEVNAWLIASNTGYISTCGAVTDYNRWLNGVSTSTCGGSLKINGPIKSGHLFLRRAYGGQHSTSAKNNPAMHPGTPAEILNLRADTYVWAYNLGRNNGSIGTMNLKELPPRY